MAVDTAALFCGFGGMVILVQVDDAEAGRGGEGGWREVGQL